MEMKVVLLGVALAAASPAFGQMKLYSFTTTREFIDQCDSASPSHECLDAIAHVEEVVDNGDNPNETCDGGPDAMIKLRSNDELTAWLAERVMRSIAWLKHHPEYDEKSYGDGIWAALKGAYCG